MKLAELTVEELEIFDTILLVSREDGSELVLKVLAINGEDVTLGSLLGKDSIVTDFTALNKADLYRIVNLNERVS